ncbi:MAG: lysophospholipid acyltransferase family protein [Anaerolineae bacterium]
MKITKLGDVVPQRGNKVSRAISRLILLAFGWQIVGHFPNIPKFVLIGAPHTSTWDFPLTMTTLFALGLRVSWMGKHTFVNGRFGRIWRWMGGVPIDRRAAHGVVEQMVDEFQRRRELILGIAPEGTRDKVARWKTGFYHIAHEAGVPIVPFIMDYGRKVVKVCEPFKTTGNIELDLPKIQAVYEGH